jgi:DNA-binding CsgD family transcriptional regulator
MISEAAELSAVVGDMYDAAINPALWQHALGSICDFVGGSSAALFWHDAATEHSQALHLFNDDPVYTRLYFEKYLPLNPMFPATTFVDEGVVVADEDIIPRAELNATRFYKEWLEPQGIASALAVNLEKGVTRTSMINLRMSVPLRDEMRRRLGLLVPHLQRAVTIGRLFDRSNATVEALSETLNHVQAGVFLVGAVAKIVFTNDTAEKMLRERLLLKKTCNTLHAIELKADRVLSNVLQSAEKGDASVGIRGIAIPLTVKEEPWFAHVLPLTSGRRQQVAGKYGAVAAVFVRKSAPNALPPLEGLAKLYDLSVGEVRVLDAMLKASGVRAIAEHLDLSPSTVKTHLRSVFPKTGVKGQKELVKLLIGH